MRRCRGHRGHQRAIAAFGRMGLAAALVELLLVLPVLVGAAADAALPCGTTGVFSTSGSGPGSTDTCTYTTAGQDSFTVPAGVSSLQVVAVGGQGVVVATHTCGQTEERAARERA